MRHLNGNFACTRCGKLLTYLHKRLFDLNSLPLSIDCTSYNTKKALLLHWCFIIFLLTKAPCGITNCKLSHFFHCEKLTQKSAPFFPQPRKPTHNTRAEKNETANPLSLSLSVLIYSVSFSNSATDAQSSKSEKKRASESMIHPQTWSFAQRVSEREREEKSGSLPYL
jgi:hypothetical protein